MGRWATVSALAVIAFGITGAQSEELAPSLVNDFRRVCLSDRPFEESLADVGKVIRLVTVDGNNNILAVESRETVPTAEWDRKLTGRTRTSAYTIGAMHFTSRQRAFKSCEIRTYFDFDMRSDLKPLLDDLAELQPPSSTISDDIASRISVARYLDPDLALWQMGNETASAVILYMSDSATTLTLIGPAE